MAYNLFEWSQTRNRPGLAFKMNKCPKCGTKTTNLVVQNHSSYGLEFNETGDEAPALVCLIRVGCVICEYYTDWHDEFEEIFGEMGTRRARNDWNERYR